MRNDAAHKINRAMLSTCTADGDSKIAATICDVMGQPFFNKLNNVIFHADYFRNFF